MPEPAGERARLEACGDAYGKGFPFHDEELALHAWYARRVLDLCAGLDGVRLLGLGLGNGVACRTFLDGFGPRLARCVVVEGSPGVVRAFLDGRPPDPRLEIRECLFEDFRSDERFDVLEMGFVLEHVADPDLLVARHRDLLAPGGRFFAAVPNARSLHRLLGHAAGLLDDLYRLGAGDLRIGHRRYFDLASLTALLRRHGLEPVRSEGLGLKPLATTQMKSLGLPDRVLEAFYRVGQDLPDICNAVMVEARLPC